MHFEHNTPRVGYQKIQKKTAVETQKSKIWEEDLCTAMREFQAETSCSERHLQRALDAFSPFLRKKPPTNVRKADKKLQAEACVSVEVLVSCDKFDYVCRESDASEDCSKCATARALPVAESEKVYYFPLKDRLRALVQTSSYKSKSEQWLNRKSNERYYSDVSDTPGMFSEHIRFCSNVFAISFSKVFQNI